jgi:hypothetical protein
MIDINGVAFLIIPEDHPQLPNTNAPIACSFSGHLNYARIAFDILS